MFANFVVIVIWILTHRPGREPKLRKKPLPDCIPTGVIFILVQGESLILAQGLNFTWRTGSTSAGFSNRYQTVFETDPYHGLDMVASLAFRIQSRQAKIFREWVLRKRLAAERQPIGIQYNYAQIHSSKQN